MTMKIDDSNSVKNSPNTVDLSIIVVNYNTKHFLHDCFKSTLASALPQCYEIILIDNKSDDDSVEYVKKHFPAIKIIANTHNVGYAKANNQGVCCAQGKYIIFLNPDTVITQDTIQRMITHADMHPNIGIIGCRVSNPNGKVQWDSCGSFFTAWSLLLKETGLEKLWPCCHFLGKRLLRYWSRNSSRDVDWVSGVCLMIRRETLDNIGLLDEQFFAYMEDMDLCRRARAKHWRVVFLHEAGITHRASSSWQHATVKQLHISLSSEKKYLEKYYGFMGAVSFQLIHFIGSSIRLLLHLFFKNYTRAKHHFQILAWLIQNKL